LANHTSRSLAVLQHTCNAFRSVCVEVLYGRPVRARDGNPEFAWSLDLEVLFHLCISGGFVEVVPVLKVDPVCCEGQLFTTRRQGGLRVAANPPNIYTLGILNCSEVEYIANYTTIMTCKFNK
jgi:hypothetical protein